MTDRVPAVLVTPDHDLLTMKRIRPGQDPYWVLPGGGIEVGEDLETALARELRDEIAAAADLHGLLYVLERGGECPENDVSLRRNRDTLAGEGCPFKGQMVGGMPVNRGMTCTERVMTRRVPCPLAPGQMEGYAARFRAVAHDSAYGDQEGFRGGLHEARLPFIMVFRPRRGTWAYGADAHTPADPARDDDGECASTPT